MLTREEVLRIAHLARLQLTEEEVTLYQNRLGRVLEYVHELNSLPAGKDGLVRHIPKDSVAFREDCAVPFSNSQGLVQNAPAVQDGCFLLPAVMDGE